MNNTAPISKAFENGKALVTYIMAGDPTPKLSGKYILAAQKAGANLIEIGIPFSDPIAEGEVIQKASVRALSAGTTLEDVFEMAEEIAPQMHVPMVFMTYLNPVFVYGYARFFARCNSCGVSALIIPDLPFEEAADVKKHAANFGIDIISLIAPTSEQRIKEIAQQAQGFIYLVSSLGVTGMRQNISTNLPALVKQVRQATTLPIAIGFGISTKSQAADIASVCDGAIVGSALVNIIAENGENAEEAVYNFVKEMKDALK